jgi:iron complex transport system substrate-binding protein
VRLVSLCPSTTETLFALGVGDALVGRTRFCIHPAPEVEAIASVGGTKDPDVDAIARLRPDVVFVNAEENRREDHDALVTHVPRAIGAVDVSEPRRVGEVPALLRHLGARVGRAEAGDALARALEAELAALDEAARGAPPFRYGYLIWRRPWMAISRDTYVADLIARAGGAPLTDDPHARYPTIELDALRAADVVFLPDEPFPFADKHLPELRAALPGVALERVSGDDACWHGARSIRGARWARSLVGRFGHQQVAAGLTRAP